jgi:peptidoglycan/xylan/chitin deacetylase (PgdA/CDA1 family)
MNKKFLTQIKIYFSTFMGIWLIFLIFMTKDQVVDGQIAALSRQANYLRYKAEFNQNTEQVGLVSAAGSLLKVFSSPAPLVSADENAQGVPVLVYHGIVDTPDRFSLTPEAFRDQMFALKRAGYEAISLDEFIDFVKYQKEIPEKSFLLTFDDGRRDSYEQADPVLKTLGWSAIMFVATGQSLDKEARNGYYINEKQTEEMLESGRWELQSHAVQKDGGFISINSQGDEGNFLSNLMWLTDQNRNETEEEYRARVLQEMTLSKTTLEEKFKLPVRAFAYPFSDYGHQTINAEVIAEDAVRKAVSQNYEVAFRQTWPDDEYFTLNYMDEDMHRLRRVEVPSTWTGEQLLTFMENASPKDLPYTDTLTIDRGWKAHWGTLRFDQNGLHLIPNEERSGAFAFLDGTRPWRDYTYTVEAQRSSGGYLTLYARYQSNGNYVSCTFGDSNTRLDERVEGETSTRVSSGNGTGRGVAEYGISVEGGDVACLYEGESVARTTGVSNKISTGGIGFRIWNESLNSSPLNLKNLKVTSLSEEISTSPSINSQ